MNYSIFYNCNSLESVEIRGAITTIPSSTFYNCWSLHSVVLPDTIERIETCAFQYCYSLNAINLTDQLTYIGASAFSQCTHLNEIYLGSNLDYIGSYAFNECQRLSCEINIPETITILRTRTFYECESLENVYLPRTVTSMESEVFKGCPNLLLHLYTNSYAQSYALANFLQYVFIDAPEYVGGTYCGINWRYVFDSYALILESENTNTQMPDFDEETYSTVPWFAYSGSIRYVYVEDSIANVGDYAFYQYPDLRVVVLSSSCLTVIGQHAFENCTKLDTVEIYSSIFTTIEEYAFCDCTSLAYMKVPNSLCIAGGGAFQNVSKTMIVESHWGSNAYGLMEHLGFTMIEKRYRVTPLGMDTGFFDHSIEYYIDNSKLDNPNGELRYMCSLLAAAGYNKELTRDNFTAMGFDSNLKANNWNYTQGHHVGYMMGYKDTLKGERIVLVVIRGSCDPFLTSPDWISDYTVGPENSRHLGFSKATEEVLSALKSYVNVYDDDVRILLTGHSRGAAVANLVAADLINSGVSVNNVFAYTFACPKVVTNSPSNLLTNSNIFNNCNDWDVVTHIPCPGVSFGNVLEIALGNPLKKATAIALILIKANASSNQWERYGNTAHFTEGHDITSLRSYEDLVLLMDHIGDNHCMPYYIYWARMNKKQ